jgi:hypothetical protein
MFNYGLAKIERIFHEKDVGMFCLIPKSVNYVVFCLMMSLICLCLIRMFTKFIYLFILFFIKLISDGIIPLMMSLMCF